jgi:hypothetical protein
MTTLARLEEMLQREQIVYEQVVGGNILKVKLKKEMPSGLDYFVYYLLLAETQYGLLRGNIWLNRISAHSIDQVEEFCRIVSVLVPPIKLVFDEERRQFFLDSLVDPDEFDEDAAKFLETCDFVHPLCLHVGKTGKWEESLEGLVHISSLPYVGRIQ